MHTTISALSGGSQKPIPWKDEVLHPGPKNTWYTGDLSLSMGREASANDNAIMGRRNISKSEILPALWLHIKHDEWQI